MGPASTASRFAILDSFGHILFRILTMLSSFREMFDGFIFVFKDVLRI